tara:strand:+ start:1030 stop:2364 length:1335 start_codon:yes stop_codon:yes gene_type:complete
MRPFVEVIAEAGEHHKEGRLNEAAFLYENLLGACPDDPICLYLYGTLLSQQKKFGLAMTLLEKSTRIEPDELPEAWHNLGVAYRNEGHTEKARDAYREAIRLRPSAELWAMLSGSYINTGTPLKALEYAQNALDLKPDLAHGHNHMALGLLELGRYAEAWPHYEYRFALDTMSASARPFECPKWDGKPVKRLAIHGEQGIGDEILFMSCFGDIEGVEEIAVECERRLIPLFERSFGVKCYPSFDEMTKEFEADAYIAMGSLPGLFRKKKEDFPGHTFLKADPAKVAKWRSRLPENPIGIAWHGGTKGTHQELRNAPLEMWADFIRGKNVVSVQYDGAAQAAELGIPHYQDAIDDLDEFAALVAALDGVVSVCQSVIHFAGGLGTPCLVFTPDQPAWRYGIEGQHMDWYGDHLELIRGDWSRSFTIAEQKIADIGRLRGAKQSVA